MKLTCLVQGDPLPQIQWFHDGRQLIRQKGGRYLIRPRTLRLVVREFRASDAGKYTCVAENRRDVVRMTYLVRAKRRGGSGIPVVGNPTTSVERPLSPKRGDSIEKLVVRQGDNVTLTCHSKDAKFLKWIVPITNNINRRPNGPQGEDLRLGPPSQPLRRRSGNLARDVEARSKVTVFQNTSKVNGTRYQRVHLLHVAKGSSEGVYKCMTVLHSEAVTVKYIELVVTIGMFTINIISIIISILFSFHFFPTTILHMLW